MAVDDLREEFIPLVSHQLREPMSAIKWFCEMLLANDLGKLSKDQKETIESISQANERMIHLINVLLHLSHLESGRIIIKPKPTDLSKLVNQILLELSDRSRAKKIKLDANITDKLPEVLIDPQIIKEVYINLIDNAIEYTARGGSVLISIFKKDSQVVSRVSDTGIGIPQKEQAQVFQKFYRGSNLPTSQRQGSGLGLHLVKHLVEASGGQIWFKSKQGHGSSFWFTLPVAKPA